MARSDAVWAFIANTPFAARELHKVNARIRRVLNGCSCFDLMRRGRLEEQNGNVAAEAALVKASVGHLPNSICTAPALENGEDTRVC